MKTGEYSVTPVDTRFNPAKAGTITGGNTIHFVDDPGYKDAEEVVYDRGGGTSISPLCDLHDKQASLCTGGLYYVKNVGAERDPALRQPEPDRVAGLALRRQRREPPPRADGQGGRHDGRVAAVRPGPTTSPAARSTCRTCSRRTAPSSRPATPSSTPPAAARRSAGSSTAPRTTRSRSAAAARSTSSPIRSATPRSRRRLQRDGRPGHADRTRQVEGDRPLAQPRRRRPDAVRRRERDRPAEHLEPEPGVPRRRRHGVEQRQRRRVRRRPRLQRHGRRDARRRRERDEHPHVGAHRQLGEGELRRDLRGRPRGLEHGAVGARRGGEPVLRPRHRDHAGDRRHAPASRFRSASASSTSTRTRTSARARS